MVTLRAQAIVPGAFKVQKVRLLVGKVLHDEGKRDRKELAKTTHGWSSAPNIVYQTGITAKEAWVWIGPTGAADLVMKWRRLDEGTDDHPISARNAPTLRFPFQGKGKSYTPKTRRRWLGSNPDGGKKEGPIFKPLSVWHPGNEPREWSQMLGEQRIGPFAANVQNAINLGMR